MDLKFNKIYHKILRKKGKYNFVELMESIIIRL